MVTHSSEVINFYARKLTENKNLFNVFFKVAELDYNKTDLRPVLQKHIVSELSASRHVVQQHLSYLEGALLITYYSSGQRYEYELTENGKMLGKVLQQMESNSKGGD